VSAPRLYIVGASGSGTTTLGASLAAHLGLPHLDADSFYWAPVQPPFSVKADRRTRNTALRAALEAPGWVLSGACHEWGIDVAGQASLIVFLTLETEARLTRLRAREAALFGPRIGEGGDMEAIHVAFMEWAASYDEPAFDGRSRAGHEAWLSGVSTPVLRLDAAQSVQACTAAVLRRL